MTSQDQPAAHGLNNGPALELRVHGVNNTTPASILDLPVDDVEEVLGDKFAGFWRPKSGRAPAGEEDRGWIPEKVTREAYSWGGLARTTPGGGTGAFGKAIAILAQVGWTLLLPYGLANVGYWTRNLSDSEGGSGGWSGRIRSALNPRGAPLPGAGASTVRVFGLALTIFMVVTVCEISMDLVATQCYERGERVCANLPGIFNGLAPHSLAVRLAAMSLVPVVLLLGLWWLSSITRARYERATLEVDALVADPSGDGGGPLLGRLGFWRGDRMVGGLVYIHLASGFAMVAFALAWPALFGAGSRCEDFDHWGECADQIGGDRAATSAFFIGCLMAASLVLVAAVVAIVRGNRRMPDLAVHDPTGNRPGNGPGNGSEQQTLWLLVVAAIVLVVTEAGLLATTPTIDEDGPLLGVDALPTVVLGLLVCLVASALVLRVNRLGPWFAWVLAACLVVLAFAEQTWLRVIVVAGALLIGIATLLCLVQGSQQPEQPGDQARSGATPRRYVAWAGGGPGVMLGAALFSQTVLSSLAVLLAGDWLNGSLSARTLLPGVSASVVPSASGCEGPCPEVQLLSVPLPYVLLGTATLLTLLLVLLAALIAYWIGRPEPGDNPAAQDAAGGGDATSQVAPPVSQRKVLRARRSARLAHRAEKLLGLFTALSTASVLGAVIATAAGWLQPGTGAGAFTWLRVYDIATSASVVVAAAALAALVKGAGSGEKRPLGLVWDLMAFLPRAAHPFAPPCYAERAVPELTDRINWWFSRDGHDFVGGQRRRGSRVIVSAHSLGGVLAVAALLQLRWKSGAREITLLTYGSQLRAYFGRIFPELLGDPAIGIRRARAAVLFAANPWKNEMDASAPHPAAPNPPGPATESMVGPALRREGVTGWISLWRPTDYLGFPVHSYEPNNGLDRLADELDRTGYLVEVVTHGHYPRSSQYRTAPLELTRDLP